MSNPVCFFFKHNDGYRLQRCTIEEVGKFTVGQVEALARRVFRLSGGALTLDHRHLVLTSEGHTWVDQKIETDADARCISECDVVIVKTRIDAVTE